MQRLAIVGAGAWGTALAVQARRAGREVMLIGRRGGGRTAGFDVQAATALDAAVDAALLAVPARAVVASVRDMAPRLRADVPLVLCAKGLDEDGPRLLADAVVAAAPGRVVAILSGPSFADEVVQDRPTAVAVAAAPVDIATAERLAAALHTKHFRPYVTADPVGVQIGGAAKNVVAIACGMARGLDLGANAEAALVTRGVAEIARLGAVAGARTATLMGLGGLGDLVLTCAGPHSRNFRFGMAVARGCAAAAAERTVGLAEGRATAPLLVGFARARGVETPIALGVADVLAGRVSLGDALDRLLERPLAREA